MESLEVYDKICHWLWAVAAIVGVDYFRNNKWNWRVVVCVNVIVVGFISIVYTLYIVRHDFTLVLKCIGTSTVAITGVAKLYSTLNTQKRQEGLILFIRRLYVVNSEGSTRRRNIMRMSSAKFFTIIKATIGLCTFIILIVAANPVYSFFFLKKVELFFEVQFVGHPMSEASARVYYVNYISQFIYITLAYTGNVLHDVILCMLAFYVYALMELQKSAFDEAEELIGLDKETFEKSFKNCMIMVQDTNNYILEINNLYSFVVFIQIGASSVAMALNLFCCVMTDWLGAYALVMLSFIQIFVYCLIGTFLEIMSDKMVDIVYQFPWYSTSYENKRLLCFTLMKTQRITKLKIGGVADLNVNTAASIFKTIYSYLMMLLNFTE
ncbi:odorant receptor 47a-like isoform X1 [Hermetia illucens]|uniref:odorant receptor 47a-like isoform X1 n=1 Tax=Hermetia illucens TaxID=343691 RepID=UPI0018CC0667|nr:odorant receptor 47a-like isoform X1 [Hermetia illucens]